MPRSTDLTDLVEIELDLGPLPALRSCLQRIGFDRPPLPRFRRMDAELARLDAVGLAEAIRTGQLSPAEALESASDAWRPSTVTSTP